MNPVDKILGADVELGNVIEHAATGVISNDYAARLLLAEIEGVPGSSSGWSGLWMRRFWGRRFQGRVVRIRRLRSDGD